MRRDAPLPGTTHVVSAPSSEQVPDAHESTNDELLTVHDAARLLSVSVSWVYEHARDTCVDRLPFVKIGKYLRFDRRDLRAYVDARREESSPLSRRR